VQNPVRLWRTIYTHLTPTDIVGLDLSLSSTGYYLIGGISGNIDTAKLSGMERIDFILARIAELVHEGNFVIIENNAFNAVGSARSKLAELNGIVKFWLWRRKIEYVLVAPSTLKKFILGAGQGEKSLIIREVFKAYELNATTDDEADACVLAHIGACLIGREEPRNKSQRECLTTLTAEKKKKKRKLKEAA
jgi:Holliday junction resolvasome RuvABC endonuclease subunit